MLRVRHVAAAGFVAACLLLSVLPLIGLVLNAGHRHALIDAHEFACPVFAILAVAWSQLRSGRQPGAPIHLLVFGALAIGCLVYNNGVGLERYPRNYLGDAAFVCASTLLCSLLKPTQWSAMSPRQWFTVATGYAVISGLQFCFVVRPFLNLDPAYPWPVQGVFYSYTLTSSLWGAMALLATLFATTFIDLMFAIGAVMICVADFASRYEAIQTVTVSTCWAEGAWACGLGLMSASVVVAVGFGKSLPLSGGHIAYRWLSVRTLFAVLASFVTAAVLGGTWFFGQLTVADAYDLSTIAALVILCWALTNALALVLAKNIEAVGCLMPNPQAILDPEGGMQKLSIPEVPEHMILFEFAQVLAGYNALAHRGNALTAALMTAQRHAVIGETAAQVAHDIRSPLAALQVCLEDFARLPEDTRVVARAAIARVHDIANNLLKQHRNESGAPQEQCAAKRPILVADLVEVVASEARAQYRQVSWVHITTDCTQAYGAFAQANDRALRRCLSNLINNAVRAVEGDGKVLVRVEQSADKIAVSVEDSGPGMPPHILEMGLDPGLSLDAVEGNGLGLRSLRAFIQENGAQADLCNMDGGGARVRLGLRCVAAPSWFLTKLHIGNLDGVVIVDDDPSIHALWDRRLRALGTEPLHFTSGSQFKVWYHQGPPRAKYWFLLDHELASTAELGPEIAAEMRLPPEQVVIVTSHSEEIPVQELCTDSGFKLLPKALVPLLPLQVGAPSAAPVAAVVLIDDDVLIHTAWRLACERRGVTLLAFRHPEAFWRASSGIPTVTPIYVDANLGSERGEELTELLADRGFSNLYLATGCDPNSRRFNNMPWLRAVVGKTPPQFDE